MQIPSVAFIEMALNSLSHLQQDVIDDELKEFRALGNRIEVASLGETTRLEYGYLLGLETARILLKTMPSAIQHDIEI
jgi:hypothetical protein